MAYSAAATVQAWASSEQTGTAKSTAGQTPQTIPARQAMVPLISIYKITALTGGYFYCGGLGV